ncbi:aminotransferase-like domain-containing protein [Amycolatopsis sp. CA-230715]|uniref:aminotransferase-like domain-containing protein n=1 Tax=Amycolatopsis sp. CA-230715 TaxID=2745196 RepID=UPI001C01B6C7|nr:PLP-dependent aminotransferase family protein [Amycolatopsis sp. CA-230715]QWF81810.1 Vitamin B6 salvage pathway transcriptional repressor PtsJ [Amycolatopsis sp. CA-230715]
MDDRDYRVVADRIAADIESGRLRPGDRLPPQRRFARQHDIANSTAARVYTDLVRRGLVTGEVGRGTFVRAGSAPEHALAEPADARVDLELNFGVLPEQPALLAASLAELVRPGRLRHSLRPSVVRADDPTREAIASAVSVPEWRADPDRLVFTGNGRQAIAAAVAALVPSGGRLGVEAITYPVVKGIATRLGAQLVPLEMDEEGVTPDAVRRAQGLHAVYLQPALHNPLGVTMSAHRREEIAMVLRQRDLACVEDRIYAFLRPELPPLAALAPERVVVVDGFSKRVSPGLTLGVAVVPDGLGGKVSGAVRSGVWAPASFALDAVTQWISDGTVATLERGKRRDAAARQELLRTRLAGFVVHADSAAYHAWWELPEPWRAETFVAAAARAGIAVTPAAAFTVGSGLAPAAVRLALSAPPVSTVDKALGALAGLAAEGSDFE